MYSMMREQKRACALLLAVAGTVIAWKWLAGKGKQKSKIPLLGSWIPFLGQSPAFFQSVAQFCHRNKEKFGGSFRTEILGHEWIFLFDTEDGQSIVKTMEKHASMYRAVNMLAKPFFPLEDQKEFDTAEQKVKLTGIMGGGTSSVPQIVHSLRPKVLRAWVPGIRQVLRNKFAMLPDSSEIDLFQWCSDLICSITVYAFFGPDVPEDEMQLWIKLLRDAEPDRGLSDPLMSLGTIADVAIRGERGIYTTMRNLIYPHLDREIARVLAGAAEPENASVMNSFVRYWAASCNNEVDFLRAARRRIANDAVVFTFAAITNSFGAAAWVLFHVVRNSAGCGDRIRRELTTVPDDSDQLPELEKTIFEITRLYTPGALMRMLTKPWPMPSTGEDLPAGAVVSVPVFDIHRNPSVWENPLAFDPQRFDPNGRDEKARAGSCFVGFGAGVHPCVGRRFAVLETSLFVSEALKTFDWELVGDDTRAEDAYTQSIIDVPRHPKLDPSQTNSLWRPLEPLLVRCSRRKT